MFVQKSLFDDIEARFIIAAREDMCWSVFQPGSLLRAKGTTSMPVRRDAVHGGQVDLGC